jgi:N-acetylmuramoyl-L-alanine amidase
MASPNFGARRNGLTPELVVIHYTAMGSCAAAFARLCDPQAEVSAHYLIDYDGTVIPLVSEAARAWHAGAGQWRGLDDINSRSIGIELANTGAEPFPEPQMAALEALLRGIMQRWAIAAEGVIAHSDMAPGRKADPGARFDWRRLALAGLSVWPEVGAAPANVDDFARLVQGFGYPDAAPETLLAAFRLRFCPWASGSIAPTEAVLAQNLAARYPR